MSGTARPVVFGEVLFDCFADGTRVLGGAPFNVGWHLQAFGAEPLLVSAVGADAGGREVRDTMARWGMDLNGLQILDTHPTGEVRVQMHDGQPSYEIVPERAFDHIMAAALPAVDASVYYHGTLALRGGDSARALEALLGRAPAPVFLDVNLRPPWWNARQLDACLARVTWLKLSDEELPTLAPDGAGGLEGRLARLMHQHGNQLAILTLGAAGAMLVDHTGACVRASPPPRAQVVDTVGAGDAFAAVCVLGLLRGWSPDTLLERAGAFAALVVGQRGAVSEDRTAYARLAEQWQL